VTGHDPRKAGPPPPSGPPLTGPPGGKPAGKFGPPLEYGERRDDVDGHSLWHIAAYLPDGREADVIKFLNDNGIEVYRAWPVRS
jgi:hypothetical protein